MERRAAARSKGAFVKRVCDIVRGGVEVGGREGGRT